MIHIITAVHNRYEITQKFVHQLLQQTYKDIHLILVDDGSTDSTSEMVLKYMPNATIIKGDGNLWWGGALHEAYKWVCSNLNEGNNDEFVIFANDDTQFDDKYIENAVNVLAKKQNILLAGYGVSKQTGKQVDGAIDFNYKNIYAECSKTEYGNCASTRSLFFRVRDFKKIGGFYPKRLPHYGSDYEWTIRACRKYGYKIMCDKSLCYQVDESTTGDNTYENMTRKSIVSVRSASNPKYKLNFIFLAIPKKYIVFALNNQLKRYLKKVKMIFKIFKTADSNNI